jgi:hypothetical protein
MREFLNGWRRKTGVATLLMGLAIVAVWVRSYRFAEFVYIWPRPGRTIQFLICPEGVWWERREWALKSPDTEERRCMFDRQTWPTPSWPMSPYDGYGPFHAPRIQWRWRLNGFDVGEFEWDKVPFGPNGDDPEGWKRRTTFHVKVWLIPFWSIVLPPTLVSAWLLLSKPRPRRASPAPQSPSNS